MFLVWTSTDFLLKDSAIFWPELIPRCGNITIYYKWVCSPLSCGLLPKRKARILSCLGITGRRNSSHESIVDTTSPREKLSSWPPTSETLSSSPNHRDQPIFAGDKFGDQFSQSTNNRGEEICICRFHARKSVFIALRSQP